MSINSLIFLFFYLYFNTISLADIYLRPRDDLNIEESLDDRVVMLVIPSNNLRTKSLSVEPFNSRALNKPLHSKKNYEKEDEIPLANLNLNDREKELLRKRWNYSCNKKAAKVCRKACITTYKTVCDSYKCSSNMKKKFKRKCRSNCNDRFNSNSKKDDTDSD